MKRVWAMVLVLAALSCAVGASAQTRAELLRYAPADEYFGPLQMSILGIRNEVNDLSVQYDANPENADAILGKAAMAEASLKDWEAKYPADPALPRYVLMLSRLYQKIDHDLARQKSIETESWLLSRYAETSYAKEELKRIAGRNVYSRSESIPSVK